MRLLRYNILNSLLARSAVVGSNILYLNSNHTVAPIPVSVAAVNFGVDRTIIVSKSVDPIIGRREDRSWRQTCSSSRSPHQIFQTTKLVFQQSSAPGIVSTIDG